MSWKALLLVIGTLILLAACSSRDSEPATQEPTSQPGQTESATLTPTPTRASEQRQPTESSRTTAPGQRIQGGTLVRLGDDPPTLDPHLTTDATSAAIIIEVFGGLLTIESDPDGTNPRIVEDLAERWDVSPDGTIYTFHLREDAVFHDGKPVTAQDFKWSMERASNPLTAAPVVEEYLGDILGVKDRLRGDATEVRGVRVIDEHTLEITIDAPKSYFLAKLTYPTAFVLDQENVESSRRWFNTPNGTGPFRLEEYSTGESLTLGRNENYHLGPPFVDKVRFILSGGTAMLMYENDEIHVTGVGLADLDRILDPSNALNAQLKQAPPSFSTSYIGMNVDEPPFDDLKFRQAMNYAIDKEAIARDVMAGLVVPAEGILPPGFPGYNPDVQGYEYDPEKARQLLAESKYGDNLDELPPIILTTPGSFGASVGLDLEVVLEMWRQNLGIEVEILRTEFATYLQDLIKRRFQMFEIGWIADYPDPENFLDLLFHSDSNNNHTAFHNEEVDRILVLARTETDEAKRYQLYHQAEDMIVREAPWISLWHSGEQYVLVKPNVKDYRLTPLIIPRLRHVYLVEE